MSGGMDKQPGVGYGRRSSADEGLSDGRGHRYGGSRNGGRGGRPRERDQRHHDRSRGGRGGGGGNHGGGMKAPIILTRDKRQEHPPIMPGAVSIMQRESSGSHLPTSNPPLRSITSPGALVPPDSVSPHPMVQQSHRQRRSEGLSSSPSNYTPLQPSSRGGGGGRGEGSSSSVLSRQTSDNLTQSNEMSHSVKMVDRNWHWEDKGTDYMLEQSDFVVVGVLGKQGVGKSTVMSLLAGTRTGAGKPFMFRTESKEVQESGGYQTTGVDMIVTSERVILLDTQPILSEELLNQFTQNESLMPHGMSPETYLEVLSLQMAIYLYTVCHVVLVVMDTMESSMVYRFLWTVEQMKASCVKGSLDLTPEMGDKPPRDYFPQLVFVLNHASKDDFQPLSIRENHLLLAEHFQGAKANIAGGVSLAKSGLVPVGRSLPSKKSMETVDPSEVNLHLLPTNQNATDTYGVYCLSRPEKGEATLNPVFKLLPSFVGHPSFQLLSETLRNQIFAMPRPPLRRTAQQQLTEREWFEFARRTWLTLKKSDLYAEYDRLLQATPPD